MEENKSYYTEARKKGNEKYLKNQDDIKLRVPKGRKEHYKEMAAEVKMSLNEFAIKSMEYVHVNSIDTELLNDAHRELYGDDNKKS